MRELVGKIPTKDPNITEVVYLSEIVRCLECQRTVPVGIEVVTVARNDDSKKVIRRVCYCRGHGFDYETKAQSLPIRLHAQSERPCSVSIILPGHDLNSKANQNANVC
jgi:hypothetical protein